MARNINMSTHNSMWITSSSLPLVSNGTPIHSWRMVLLALLCTLESSRRHPVSTLVHKFSYLRSLLTPRRLVSITRRLNIEHCVVTELPRGLSKENQMKKVSHRVLASRSIIIHPPIANTRDSREEVEEEMRNQILYRRISITN